MLNNTFTLIGTAVSDYEKVDGAKYERYKLSVEVERKNKSRVDLYKITVLNWNKTIDVKQKVAGDVVIVNGYLDSFNDKVELIAQDVYLVGASLDYKNEIESVITPKTDFDDDDDEEEEISVDEDDLPF